MKPVVSVVLPVRNGGRWLKQAVQSILDQTFGQLELIVVDDHSSDNSLDDLPRADSRLKVMHNGGRGVSSAFNTGLAESAGRFVARMDADDLALPARLEMQLDYLRQNPDLDLCGAQVEIFVTGDTQGSAPAGGNRHYQAWLNACSSPDEIRRAMFVESPIPNPTALFRRAALRKLRGYGDPEWPEDYDLFLRADRLGMRMGKPDRILLRWRDHGRRLTRNSPRYEWNRFQSAKAYYLVRGRLRSLESVVIWGAGPGGCKMHDLLQAEGMAVRGFLDVHPRRIGKEKRGLPVWALEHVACLRDAFILVAVRARVSRPKIRAFLQQQGRVEGEDYLFVC
jgi:glycosyltransferase involved in cell wall biosynthesis